MTIKQLLQLASNPYYIMSEKELKQLEEYNSKLYENRKKIVKHKTGFDKHDPIMRKEDDGEIS